MDLALNNLQNPNIYTSEWYTQITVLVQYY